MIVVSGREFRASQAKYLEAARAGEDVILKSRRGAFRIIPVSHDDAVCSEQQLSEMIDRSLKQISHGEAYTMLPGESAEQFINRMLAKG